MEVNVWLNLENNRHHVGILHDRNGSVFFQYASGFIRKGLDISPYRLPLQSSVWRSSNDLFNGLPGVFADSLPHILLI